MKALLRTCLSWMALAAATAGTASAAVELVAVGHFQLADGHIAANGTALWDGAAWSSMDARIGPDGFVWAVLEVDGAVVIGGDFDAAGDAPETQHIAAWRSSRTPAWASVGGGMDAMVRVLAQYDGRLVAGGYFSRAGTTPAAYIAQWNGSAWAPLGVGLASSCSAMAVYDGSLVVGTQAFSSNAILRWDGGSWWSLGDGVVGAVNTLLAVGNVLYAGGQFSQAGAANANNIAQWNGTEWLGMGDGTNSWVHALCEFQGVLIVGGLFTQAGNVPMLRLASWDGAAWSPVGSADFDSGVDALAVVDGTLYVGGRFHLVGSIAANNVARFDGASWGSLRAGVDDWILALALYVGDGSPTPVPSTSVAKRLCARGYRHVRARVGVCPHGTAPRCERSANAYRYPYSLFAASEPVARPALRRRRPCPGCPYLHSHGRDVWADAHGVRIGHVRRRQQPGVGGPVPARQRHLAAAPVYALYRGRAGLPELCADQRRMGRCELCRGLHKHVVGVQRRRGGDVLCG